MPVPDEIRKNPVLAVIVSYNGGSSIGACVTALRHQVGSILIVDNASDRETRAVISKLLSDPAIKAMWLQKNIGVAGALNIGLKTAEANGYDWLLTMDQDSVSAPDMIECYFQSLQKHPDIASFTPNIDALGQHTVSTDVIDVGHAITSGNMVRTEAAIDVGGFETDLFIDCIDFDFSLKLRSKNYRICRVSAAHMAHSLGLSTDGKKVYMRRYYTNHPPFRVYYMFRNFVFILKRHFWQHKRFVLKLAAASLMQLIAISINGPRRRECLLMAFTGLYDGLRRPFKPAGKG